MSQRILILGAASAIARATAFAFAKRNDELYLAGRDVSELQRIATDLQVRCGARVKWGFFDVAQTDTHANFFARVAVEMGVLDGVLFAAGHLDDPALNDDFSKFEQIIQINFTGAVSILNYCAAYFAKRHHGFIIGISSVAGDRGRGVNHIYGAAKGAFSLYLQGLRARLHPAGVHVLTVKPGFVDSPMTFGRSGLFCVADPVVIGKKIVKVLEKKRNVVYLPRFWYYVMLIVKLVPESVFKRLQAR